jgi:hypothetical protein
VSPASLLLLRPLFRYSPMRDAYVMRFIGRTTGPVLVERPTLESRPPSATR